MREVLSFSSFSWKKFLVVATISGSFLFSFAATCTCPAGMTCSPGGGNSSPPTTPVANQAFWQSKGGSYSYNDGCLPGSEANAITTVLRYNGNKAKDYFNKMGWDHGDAIPGYNPYDMFRENGVCVQGELSQANKDGVTFCFTKLVCANSRWHARCNINSVADPGGGTFASCTPHWDAADGSPIDGCVHWVPQVYNGSENFTGSGVDAGKDKLWWVLVKDLHQHFEGAQYWDNRLTQKQCRGGDDRTNDYTGSNGWVNIIGLDANVPN
jgi:hypothetical protein